MRRLELPPDRAVGTACTAELRVSRWGGGRGWSALPSGLGSSFFPGTRGLEGQQEGLEGWGPQAGGVHSPAPLLPAPGWRGSRGWGGVGRWVPCWVRAAKPAGAPGLRLTGAVTSPPFPVPPAESVGQVGVGEELVG